VVATMTKTTYICRVHRELQMWVMSVDLPEFGVIEAETEDSSEIDFLIRSFICDCTEQNPFDFDMRYEFVGESPKYFLD
jgi:hypothetical protein